jgi:acetoin utilization deacetylase AcuC-like enzyme
MRPKEPMESAAPQPAIHYETISTRSNHIVPRDKFRKELEYWYAAGTTQKARLETMISALQNPDQKRIRCSEHYQAAAELCKVSADDAEDLKTSEDINKFLKEKTNELLEMLDTNPIFKAWQQISSITTLCIFYQASLLAAILENNRSLQGLLNEFLIIDPTTDDEATEVSTQIKNDIAHTSVWDNDLATTASGFLHFIERIDFLMTNQIKNPVLMLPPGHHAEIPIQGILGAKGFCWAYAEMIPAINHLKPVFVIDIDINAQSAPDEIDEPDEPDESQLLQPPKFHGQGRDNFFFSEVAANRVYPLYKDSIIDPKSKLYQEFYSKTDACYRVDASFSGEKTEREALRTIHREEFEKHVNSRLNALEEGSLVVLSMGMDSIEGDPFSEPVKIHGCKYYPSLWSRDTFISFVKGIQKICDEKNLKLLTTIEGGYNLETLEYVTKELYGQKQPTEDEDMEPISNRNYRQSSSGSSQLFSEAAAAGTTDELDVEIVNHDPLIINLDLDFYNRMTETYNNYAENSNEKNMYHYFELWQKKWREILEIAKKNSCEVVTEHLQTTGKKYPVDLDDLLKRLKDNPFKKSKAPDAFQKAKPSHRYQAFVEFKHFLAHSIQEIKINISLQQGTPMPETIYASSSSSSSSTAGIAPIAEQRSAPPPLLPQQQSAPSSSQSSSSSSSSQAFNQEGSQTLALGPARKAPPTLPLQQQSAPGSSQLSSSSSSSSIAPAPFRNVPPTLPLQEATATGVQNRVRRPLDPAAVRERIFKTQKKSLDQLEKAALTKKSEIEPRLEAAIKQPDQLSDCLKRKIDTATSSDPKIKELDAARQKRMREIFKEVLRAEEQEKIDKAEQAEKAKVQENANKKLLALQEFEAAKLALEKAREKLEGTIEDDQLSQNVQSPPSSSSSSSARMQSPRSPGGAASADGTFPRSR